MSTHRSRATFPIAEGELTTLKLKMLNWCNRFGIFLYLDSNEYTLPQGQYELLAGAGARHTIQADDRSDAFRRLQEAHDSQPDWRFGHFCYDLKNTVEPQLQSDKASQQGFPEMLFFVPEVVCGIRTGSPELFIESYAAPAAIWAEIQSMPAAVDGAVPQLALQPRVSRETYLQTVRRLQEHIREGDCYEINYCCEAFAEGVALPAPVAVYHGLAALSPAPFAACYRVDAAWLFCASPERFLQKRGSRLLSQPIKGTARRSADPAEDAAFAKALQDSEKERAENVMITDLVRNDLARSCVPGSVTVEELFGIQHFPQVHQLVTTVAGTVRSDIGIAEAIANAFPMGSMTGAPKVKVMELIERYEASRRGLYSGAVGYLSPEGDFDFNVVIRSLLYNADSGYLSGLTGGAITWDSEPESEWEEMQLKGWALQKIFKHDNDGGTSTH